MTGAFIILAVTVAIGILLWAWEKWRTLRHGSTLHHHDDRSRSDEGERPESRPRVAEKSSAVCCGLHTICEKTGKYNEPPVYYDDEELDRFAGKSQKEYTEDDIEEFRDIILTLRPEDAVGWKDSLEKRQIPLPEELISELELLLSESP